MVKRKRSAETPDVQVGTPEVRSVTPDQVVYPAVIPEILVDGISGVQVVNGIVRFHCFAVRQSAAGGGADVPTVVLRLAMAVPTLLGIHQAVSQLIEKLQLDAPSTKK